MTARANHIARTVINQFEKLPSKRKPITRSHGLQEWVPLSGIVAESDGEMVCLALATGMKCLPSSKLDESNGVGIHDWHAEVLAIRTFNRFLLDECQKAIQNPSLAPSICEIGRRDASRPFKIGDNVKLHMYCSEAPCGDASMELIMAAQDDASPWDIPTSIKAETLPSSETSLPGRAFFSHLGVVRRKPGRGDAPSTLSKSCSDKLSLKQCTSLLSSLTSLFVDPSRAYIDTLVLPESQYSEEACRRAFSSEGRMKPLAGLSWGEGYAFKPFSIEATSLEFNYSKRAVQARSERISASNLAATWSLSGFEETLVGGVVQGRKPFDVRGASRVSRRQMWAKAKELSDDLNDHADVQAQLTVKSYKDVKDGSLLSERRKVKSFVREHALKGWIRNEEGLNFGLFHESS